MSNIVSEDPDPDLGKLLLFAPRISDREMLQRLGVTTWQFYVLGSVVVFLLTLYLGSVPVLWVAARLGHKIVIPVWRDPLWGPAIGAWILVLYAVLYGVIAFERRRHFLAVYERGFSLSGSRFAYDDICEVRFGKKQGRLASWISKVNASIPLPANHWGEQLGRNSSSLSLTLVMNDGQIRVLVNFLAWFPNDALAFVARALGEKRLADSSLRADDVCCRETAVRRLEERDFVA